LGEAGHSFQAVQGPVSDGVDILVRDDLRFEGEPPHILAQFAMACCLGHNQAQTGPCRPAIDAALILAGCECLAAHGLATLRKIGLADQERLGCLQPPGLGLDLFNDSGHGRDYTCQ
jgi:hypothetical protein